MQFPNSFSIGNLSNLLTHIPMDDSHCYRRSMVLGRIVNYVIWYDKSKGAPPNSYSPVNIWYDLKQIATEFVSVGMHSGEVSLEHTKNPLRHLWGKQVKSAIKVTFSH